MESCNTHSRPKVLITGINGFIASHVAAAFLRAGYSVRGSYWSQNPVTDQLLDALYKQIPDDIGYKTSFVELVEVEDITRPGAFDEAVQGQAIFLGLAVVALSASYTWLRYNIRLTSPRTPPGVVAICHLASPISLQFTDPQPVMHAAVEGTRSLLRSALDHAGHELKAFVLCGSSTAMGLRSPDDQTSIFTEEDWNDAAVKMAQELGSDTPGRFIYAASKTAAERASWNFHQETQAQRRFSMITINPATVFGPPLYMPPRLDLLSPSIRILYDTVVEGKGVSAVKGGGTVMSAVDVRDVARLMLWATQHPHQADGQRYLACAWDAAPETVTQILRSKFPQISLPMAGSSGSAPISNRGNPIYNGDKALKATGKDWTGLEESIVDSASFFLSLH